MVAGQNVEEGIKVSVLPDFESFFLTEIALSPKGGIPKCNLHEVPFLG